MQAENDKLSKKYEADTKKLNESLNNANSALNKHLIDGSLSDSLLKAGVKPEYLEATKALLRGNASLKDESGELKAYVKDKPLNDFVKEWASGEGKAFIGANEGQGGGASGGNNANVSGNFGGTPSEREAAIKAKYKL